MALFSRIKEKLKDRNKRRGTATDQPPEPPPKDPSDGATSDPKLSPPEAPFHYQDTRETPTPVPWGTRDQPGPIHYEQTIPSGPHKGTKIVGEVSCDEDGCSSGLEVFGRPHDNPADEQRGSPTADEMPREGGGTK